MTGGALTPLTKEQVATLKSTFRLINAHQLGSLFYKKLFQQHPHLRSLFPADMGVQITKIISVIELIVFSFEEKSFDKFLLQDSLLIPLRNLGIKHAKKGVANEHYPIVNKLLLETIQEVGGSKINDEVMKTWTLALGHLTFAMLNDSIKESGESKTSDDPLSWIKKIIKRN
jgi:hemoglobin-like flavoprotein